MHRPIPKITNPLLAAVVAVALLALTACETQQSEGSPQHRATTPTVRLAAETTLASTAKISATGFSSVGQPVSLGESGFAFASAAGMQSTNASAFVQDRALFVADLRRETVERIVLPDGLLKYRNFTVLSGSGEFVVVESCDLVMDSSTGSALCADALGAASKVGELRQTLLVDLGKPGSRSVKALPPPSPQFRLLGSHENAPTVLMTSLPSTANEAETPALPGFEATAGQLARFDGKEWHRVGEPYSLGWSGNLPQPCATAGGTIVWAKGEDPNKPGVVGGNGQVTVKAVQVLSETDDAVTEVAIGPITADAFTLVCTSTGALLGSRTLGQDAIVFSSGRNGVSAVEGFTDRRPVRNLRFDPISGRLLDIDDRTPSKPTWNWYNPDWLRNDAGISLTSSGPGPPMDSSAVLAGERMWRTFTLPGSLDVSLIGVGPS